MNPHRHRCRFEGRNVLGEEPGDQSCQHITGTGRCQPRRRIGIDDGTAVWTTAGSLCCRKGIAHAITLRYNRGVREPTTPDLVGAAFEAALALADAHDARTLACYVMCAREGYSTVPGAEAPRVMLQAMLSALESAAPADRRVLLFIPSDGDRVPRLLLHWGLPSAGARRSVWWCDASIGRKQATLDRLSAAGLDIKFTFDDNDTVLADAQA